MAQENFKDCLAVTLEYEGGFVDHPRDPGGATNKGVTLATFRAYHPGATVIDLRSISDKQVERIYRDGYWKPVRGDDLPAGVDLAVFDFGVNSGPSRSARHLQAVVGVTQDGKVGPATVRAAGERNGADVVRQICARRLSFVRGLRTWGVFGRGWSRRIADVEARGVAMWLKENASLAGSRMALDEYAGEALSKSRAQSSGAVGAGGGGAVGGAADLSIDPSVVAVVAGALVLAAVVLLMKSRQNKDRADAYDRVSAEMSA